MTTIRVKKDERYFSASNEPFNDKRLSWEARGLMGYLLSKPNNWKVRMVDLDKQGPAGGRKLKRMLAELRLYGYMNRIRVKLENGKFDWVTDVYESPSQNPNPTNGVITETIPTKRTSAKRTGAKRRDIVKTDSPKTDTPSKEGEGATPTPPEIKLYREVTKKYPPSPNNEDVVGHIQAVKARLNRDVTADDLRPFYKAWTGNGWNQFSINWLEYAVSGILPTAKFTGKNQPTPSVADLWLIKKEQEARHGRTA